MSRYDVIGIEDLVMDFVIEIDKLPGTDGFARLLDYCWQGGGNVGSAIVALARLGGSTGMISVTGTDPFGEFCKHDMEYNGVDISHIKSVPGKTTYCICMAEKETQGRSLLGMPGELEKMSVGEVDEAYIKEAQAIHLGMPYDERSDAAVSFAKKNGVLVSLDASSAGNNAIEIVSKTDILIMSEMFYNALFCNDAYEENCRRLLQYGPSVCIVTLGKRGCAGADKDGTFVIPAFADRKYEIVDTTGAGDVFHGGFLYAYLNRYKKEGWNYSLKDCARFASAVAYINCLSLGGRAGAPTVEMVDAFLHDGKIFLDSLDERKAHYKKIMF